MINLVGEYTEEIWKRGGSKKEHKKFIGKGYVSWSQIETFNDDKGFNTGLLGEYEWLLNKISKVEFDDMGWGQFGSEVEAYTTLRDKKDLSKCDPQSVEDFKKALITLKDHEKEVLNKIEPLGVFQDEICYYVEELDIIVLGYIDDRTKETKDKTVKKVRDYKTKSESSKEDLHKPKKHQIEIYVLGLQQRGLTVESAEYCIIERLGGYQCMQGGGREVLSVGERIWYEPYSFTSERLQETHNLIVDTVKRMSSIKNTYDKFFNKKD